jgi:hypothetical protein
LVDVEIYLEVGRKRVFAGALAWPGWCRSGQDEAGAVEALVAYAPRYTQVLRLGRTVFALDPLAGMTVSQRLEGDATTDFGGLGGVPDCDRRGLDAQELERQLAILQATWRAFDQSVQLAKGRQLRKGPRGGGRDLERVREHALESQIAYLGRLGIRFSPVPSAGMAERERDIRRVILESLQEQAHVETPPVGPRGGLRWLPRTFIRREAWHSLDHAWEIEDRRI